jgi:hypothetical protein
VVGNFVLGPLPIWRWLPGGQTLKANAAHVSGHDRVAARALRLIPKDAAVTATNGLGAHLSERKRILSFPIVDRAAWLALDEKNPSLGDQNAGDFARRKIEDVIRDARWRIVFERDGVVVLRRERAG